VDGYLWGGACNIDDYSALQKAVMPSGARWEVPSGARYRAPSRRRGAWVKYIGFFWNLKCRAERGGRCRAERGTELRAVGEARG
jgi:hypothetical protein